MIFFVTLTKVKSTPSTQAASSTSYQQPSAVAPSSTSNIMGGAAAGGITIITYTVSVTNDDLLFPVGLFSGNVHGHLNILALTSLPSHSIPTACQCGKPNRGVIGQPTAEQVWPSWSIPGILEITVRSSMRQQHRILAAWGTSYCSSRFIKSSLFYMTSMRCEESGVSEN